MQHPVDRADTGKNCSGQKTVSAYGREFSGTAPRLFVVYRITVGKERTDFHVEPKCVQIGLGGSVLVGDLGGRIRTRCFRRLDAGRLTPS